MSVRIVELYPESLSLNGDVGNRMVLARRMRLAGWDVVESAYRAGDELSAEDRDADVVLIGSGTSSALRQTAPDVARIAEWLRERATAGAVILAAGGGFGLLGRSLRLSPTETLTGAGVFDVETDAAAERVITEGFAVDSADGLIVGTENHTTTVRRGAGVEPFGTVVRHGRGNGDGTEGALHGNAIGTHCHGPLLAMNPRVADRLIASIAQRRGLRYERTSEHEALDVLIRRTRAILLTKASGVTDDM